MQHKDSRAMKFLGFVSTAIVVQLCLVRSTLAEQRPADYRFGVGTAFGLNAGQPFGSILLPIRVMNFVRLEPELGLSVEDTNDPLTTSWSVVAAFSAVFTWGEGPLRPAIGLRLGYNESGSTVHGADASKCGAGTMLQGQECVPDVDGNPSNNPLRTLPVKSSSGGAILGLIAGAEYVFDDTVGISVEARLTYLSNEGGAFSAAGVAAVRAYFP